MFGCGVLTSEVLNQFGSFFNTATWIWGSSIFSSIKPKYDKRLLVYFCIFHRFYLNLPVLHQKMFWISKQNKFRCKTGKFRYKQGRTQMKEIWIFFIFIKLSRWNETLIMRIWNWLLSACWNYNFHIL